MDAIGCKNPKHLKWSVQFHMWSFSLARPIHEQCTIYFNIRLDQLLYIVHNIFQHTSRSAVIHCAQYISTYLSSRDYTKCTIYLSSDCTKCTNNLFKKRLSQCTIYLSNDCTYCTLYLSSDYTQCKKQKNSAYNLITNNA